MNGLLKRIKSRFCNPAPVGITKLLTDYHGNHYFDVHNFLLIPSSSLQANQMFEAHVKATRTDWNLGGYVFVSSRRAEDVLRILDRQGITPIVVYNAKEIELKLFMDVLRTDKQQVRVYVEDDTLPAHERQTRFEFIQRLMTEQIKVLWTSQEELLMTNSEYKALMDRVNPPKRDATRCLENSTDVNSPTSISQRLPVVFDLDLQTRKGFSVMMAIAKHLVSFCVIAHRNEFSYKASDPRMAGAVSFCEDEHRSILANSVSIYGSGPTHHKEFSKLYGHHAIFGETIKQPYDKVMVRPAKNLDMDEFYAESNRAVVFFGAESPALIDLSK
jgi:hypothetical protein